MNLCSQASSPAQLQWRQQRTEFIVSFFYFDERETPVWYDKFKFLLEIMFYEGFLLPLSILSDSKRLSRDVYVCLQVEGDQIMYREEKSIGNCFLVVDLKGESFLSILLR